jgi:peptide alpha-N-acetyltransferase
MPPKSAKGKAGNGGRTKQQVEEDELTQMTQMAMTLYEASHKKNLKNAQKKGSGPHAEELTLESLAERKERAKEYVEETHRRLLIASTYVNVFVPMTEDLEWTKIGPNKWIRFEQFKQDYLAAIVQLLMKSLSEPYNCFTYEYFFAGWPDLGLVGFGAECENRPDPSFQGEIVATVVSKVSRKSPDKLLRGYIAMLAVAEHFRGFRLGEKLVTMTVHLMKKKKVEEVALETPTSNTAALHLYRSLGFAKTKFLNRYYLDGQDAVRLKLWLKSPFEAPDASSVQRTAMAEFQRALSLLSSLEQAEDSLFASQRTASRVTAPPE